MRAIAVAFVGLALCLPYEAAQAQYTTSDKVNTFNSILNSVIGVVKELKGTNEPDPNDPNALQTAPPGQAPATRPAPQMQYSTPAPQHPPFDPQVLQAQTLLNQLGYRTGVPDGIKGKVTTNAIRSFQYARRMPETGDVDPTLLQALTESVAALTTRAFAPAPYPAQAPQPQMGGAPAGYAPPGYAPPGYAPPAYAPPAQVPGAPPAGAYQPAALPPPGYVQPPQAPVAAPPQNLQGHPPHGYAPAPQQQVQYPVPQQQPVAAPADPQQPAAGHAKGGEPSGPPGVVTAPQPLTQPLGYQQQPQR